MENGKIYITISDKRNVGGTQPQLPQELNEETQNEKENGLSLKSLATHQFTHNALNITKEMVGYSLHNIGNFTGDYNSQRIVNAGEQVASRMLSVGMGFAVGGVVGGVMTILAMGIRDMGNYYKEFVGNTKQNHEILQLREISGLNALTNGSR